MKAAKGKESNLVQGPQDMVDLKYDDFISMYSYIVLSGNDKQLNSDNQGTVTLGIIIRLHADDFVQFVKNQF